MALQLGAMRDALIDAGASPDKAAGAAEELAGYEGQFSAIRADIAALKVEITSLRGEFTPIKWMLATTIAGVLSLVMKAFIH